MFQTYQHNLNCEWLIRMPVGDRIKLTFLTFDIEQHSSCRYYNILSSQSLVNSDNVLYNSVHRYDSVEVREGGDEESPLVGRYCGNTLPPSYVSQGNQVLVHFRSDWSQAGLGFKAKYELGNTYLFSRIQVLLE